MVSRLVIVNSFPRYRERTKIRLAAWLAPRVPLRAAWAARRAASRLGLFIDGVGREDRERFFSAIRSVDPEGYARRLRLIAEFDIEDRLSEIQAPTLLLAAERDLIVRSVREARLMARRIPNSRMKALKGVGHASLLGNNVRIADLLAE